MHDPVNSPSHYAQGGIESIEAIQASMSGEAFKGFLKGNCQKYLWRYEHKNGKEDLLKCHWYLDRLISEIEAEEELPLPIGEDAQRESAAYAEALLKLAESTDPDAYMISGCPSFRQGPPEPLNDYGDCWERAYG
jgi:hypothetical protein